MMHGSGYYSGDDARSALRLLLAQSLPIVESGPLLRGSDPQFVNTPVVRLDASARPDVQRTFKKLRARVRQTVGITWNTPFSKNPAPPILAVVFRTPVPCTLTIILDNPELLGSIMMAGEIGLCVAERATLYNTFTVPVGGPPLPTGECA